MALGPGWGKDFRPGDMAASFEDLSGIDEIDADLLYEPEPDYDDTEDREELWSAG